MTYMHITLVKKRRSGRDKSQQTVQTQIRLSLKKQSDLSRHDSGSKSVNLFAVQHKDIIKKDERGENELP